MNYWMIYKTGLDFDDILLESDGIYLTGLTFIQDDDINITTSDLEIFRETICWLDIYFSGKIPDFDLKYRLLNETPFRREVWDILNTIPYGKTMTYGDIAKIIAKNRNIKRMSSQAVGGAVGKNPLCIIIPCHRVIGNNNKIVGYAGGIKNKKALLKLENIDIDL